MRRGALFAAIGMFWASQIVLAPFTAVGMAFSGSYFGYALGTLILYVLGNLILHACLIRRVERAAAMEG